MSFFIEQVRNYTGAIPCLFYPMAKKMGISLSRLLSDSQVQANLLIETSRNYSVNAIIRMTELWCEAASYGMVFNIADNDFPKLGEPLCSDVDELVDIKVPQIENEITDPLINAVRLSVPHMEKPLIVGVTGPYTLCSVLNGSEDFMMNCMMDPDAVHDFLSRVTDYLIEYISAYKAVGASGVILAEPSTSMISSAMMEEFSNGYVKKIIEAVQDNSFSLIYHNCDSVNKHLEAISKLDADAFHFGNEVDLGLAFNFIGKDKFVMGNIDPRFLIMATSSDIESRTTKLLNTYAGTSNWILSTGCDLSPNVSIESVECFLQCANKFLSQK